MLTRFYKTLREVVYRRRDRPLSSSVLSSSDCPRERRRWRRDVLGNGAVVKVGSEEFLAKATDLSENGLGLALSEKENIFGCLAHATVLFGHSFRQFRGWVVSGGAMGRRNRLGLRLALSHPPPWWNALQDERATPFDADAPWQISPTPPASSNFGSSFPVLSPRDFHQMRQTAVDLAGLLRKEGATNLGCWEEQMLYSLAACDNSSDRLKICRELFRAMMVKYYPVSPGITLRGRIRLVGGRQGDVPPPSTVMLDRFAVARSDTNGQFIAQGIVAPPVFAALPVWVRHPQLRGSQAVGVTLGIDAHGDRELEILVQRQDEPNCDVAHLENLIETL